MNSSKISLFYLICLYSETYSKIGFRLRENFILRSAKIDPLRIVCSAGLPIFCAENIQNRFQEGQALAT